MSKQTRRPGQVYDVVHRQQSLSKRLMMYSFDDHVSCAYRGDAQPLCEYLLSDTPLSQENRRKLADLISRRIQLKQRGRPRGSDPAPVTEAVRQIAYDVRRLQVREYGNKAAPKGKLDLLIDKVMDQRGEDGHDLKGATRDNIRAALRRTARRKNKSA